MRKTGIVDLPLHVGKCPRWLFSLMRNLSGKIVEVIVNEYNEDEVLKRISDPYWFQALGCAIGFDWHSSGLTTTTTGALKEALNKLNLGIYVAGGKGKTSGKAIDEIVNIGDKLNIGERGINEMTRASKLCAKVDNALVQDGYKLYHHSFFLTRKNWAVIQQGMNDSIYARRYHWLSFNVKRFVSESHSGIVSDRINNNVFNLTAKEVEETRKISVELIKDNPKHLERYVNSRDKKGQTKLFQFGNFDRTKTFSMSSRHFPTVSANMKSLLKAYEQQPKDYEELTLVKGMGAKNLRALALISHLVYGTEVSWEDPCKFSFAHGGKDGWPYPVSRDRPGESVEFLDSAIRKARIGDKERFNALKRLNSYYQGLLIKR